MRNQRSSLCHFASLLLALFVFRLRSRLRTDKMLVVHIISHTRRKKSKVPKVLRVIIQISFHLHIRAWFSISLRRSLGAASSPCC